MMKGILFCLGFCAFACGVPRGETLVGEGQTTEVENEKEQVASDPKGMPETFAKLITGRWERTEGHGLKYRIFGSPKMKSSKGARFPLVVWLHGKSGNVMKPKEPGRADEFSDPGNFRKRPCFAIAPQNPDQKGWKGEAAEGVVEIVEELVKNLPIDPDRIYLVGYSMGGYGTFHLLSQEPKLFAAGVPIAGGGDPKSVAQLNKVAVWAFHGGKDKTVPPSRSRAMVAALKKAGADVKYTEIPEAGHGVVQQVIKDEAMHEWLFAQRKAK